MIDIALCLLRSKVKPGERCDVVVPAILCFRCMNNVGFIGIGLMRFV